MEELIRREWWILLYRIIIIITCIVSLVTTNTCADTCQCYETTNTVDCSNRGLTTLPNFANLSLSRVDFLDLSYNNLTILNADALFSMLGSRHVDTIDASFNQIISIIGEFDDGVDALDYRVLNLSNNLLEEFPRNIVPIEHLKFDLIIDISNNLLKSLPQNLFLNKEYREFKFIAHSNNIKTVHPYTFAGLVTVGAVFDFRNNLLESISEDLLLPEGVSSMLLAGNSWNCDCKFRWIYETRYKNFTNLSPPICFKPDHVLGRFLFNLSETEFLCAPKIIGDTNIVLIRGASQMLFCPVEADPPNHRIIWTITVPDGSANPTLISVEAPSIQLFNIKQSGIMYECKATNAAGGVTVKLILNVIENTTIADEELITEIDGSLPDLSTLLDYPYPTYLENDDGDTSMDNNTNDISSGINELSTTLLSIMTTTENMSPTNMSSTISALTSYLSTTSESGVCVSYPSFIIYLMFMALASVIVIIFLVSTFIYCICRTKPKRVIKRLSFRRHNTRSGFSFEGPGMVHEEECNDGVFHFTESSTAL